MSEILRYRPPGARFDAAAKLAMRIFLVSWALLFAGLFAAYAVLRLRASGAWPLPGQVRLPRMLPTCNALVLLASSGTLQVGLWRVRAGKPLELAASLVLTLLLGLLFLGLQGALWWRVYSAGLRPDGSTSAALFYGWTGLHALHLSAGLGALVILLSRTLDDRYNSAKFLAVQLSAMHWHFVDALWWVALGTLFLW